MARAFVWVVSSLALATVVYACKPAGDYSNVKLSNGATTGSGATSGHATSTTTTTSSGFGGCPATSSSSGGVDAGALNLCACEVLVRENDLACTTCFEAEVGVCGACAELAAACVADQKCAQITACIAMCMPSDAPCVEACLAVDDAPHAQYRALLRCACGGCAKDCALATPPSCALPIDGAGGAGGAGQGGAGHGGAGGAGFGGAGGAGGA
jgi:hypothetical protein